jgi:dipeptidyl aminopeptidase/acylaminoacyl peptidase
MRASVGVLTGLVSCCVASAGAQSLPPVAAFDRPFFYPVDPKVRTIIDGLKAPLGNTFVRLIDSGGDENAFVVHTNSDVDPGTFYLLDVAKGSLRLIGSAYPNLDKKSLPRLQSISFPAADGTTIPGYLTVPVGRRAEHLPLIVMPHGGPQARDHWDFDPLRLFLASRGYAVLQVNFRGSTGYGTKWLMDAHQDWGGLTYSDIADGARWVVKQGIADPERTTLLTTIERFLAENLGPGAPAASAN